jgi:hypothetical protein
VLSLGRSTDALGCTPCVDSSYLRRHAILAHEEAAGPWHAPHKHGYTTPSIEPGNCKWGSMCATALLPSPHSRTVHCAACVTTCASADTVPVLQCLHYMLLHVVLAVANLLYLPLALPVVHAASSWACSTGCPCAFCAPWRCTPPCLWLHLYPQSLRAGSARKRHMSGARQLGRNRRGGGRSECPGWCKWPKGGGLLWSRALANTNHQAMKLRRRLNGVTACRHHADCGVICPSDQVSIILQPPALGSSPVPVTKRSN